MKKSITKIMTVLALCACSFAVVSGDELKSSEIISLFGGNTVHAYSEIKKAPVSLFYDKNGEVRGMFANGKIGATKWWVKDNGQICLKGKSGDLCFAVINNNGMYQKYLVKGDGSRILAFSMKAFSTGNANQY